MNQKPSPSPPDRHRVQHPPLFVPFASGLNPLLPQATRQMWYWIDETRLAPGETGRRQIRRTRPDLFAGRVYPDADLELLVLACHWLAVNFRLDDQLDEGPGGRQAEVCRAAIDELSAVLGGQLLDCDTQTPLSCAYADVWRRTATGRPEGWCRAFAQDLCSFLESYYVETVHRTTGHRPGIEEYLAHRRATVGMGWLMDLAELTLPDYLPDEVRGGAAMQELRNAAAEHVGLVNDVFSLQREVALGYYHNAVVVVHETLACDLQEALQRVSKMVADTARRFVAAESALPAALTAQGVDRPTRRLAYDYAKKFRPMMRGNHDWHFEVERHRTDDLPTDGTAPDYAHDLLESSDYQPLSQGTRRAEAEEEAS